MDKLDEARREINAVDREMAALFVRRMEAARAVAAYKKEHGLPVLDAAREQAVLAQGAAAVENEEIRPYYLRFLQEEMALSKQFQERLLDGLKVAYSGVAGAFAEIAAKRAFPYGRPVPFADFRSAYEAVTDGTCDCCVLPIENSSAGEVGQVMDLAFGGSLYVNGVYVLKIAQHLLGVPGAKAEDVRRVVSHPQALSQCADYIRRHGYQTEEAVNTAVAAQLVLQAGDPSVAAIASEETAHLYGLTVLDHDVNESEINTTRFAVFSPVKNRSTEPGHFLLMFTVRNEAGALAKAINVIGAHGFNMKALRSRPMRELAWQYYFYVEADGDETSEDGQKMLAELAENCDRLKVLGHYGADIPLKEVAQ